MSVQIERLMWLKPGEQRKLCRKPVRPQTEAGHSPFRLILLGPPGVGKGTQAAFLCKKYGTCHLSTGELFRSGKNLPPSQRSPAMESAVQHMVRGDLVPDVTVLELVHERVHCLHCDTGFLLDGFPRTVVQAEALQRLLLSEGMALDAVLDYTLPIDEVVRRISGRRTCIGCNASYHVWNCPPRRPGFCDLCGDELCQREDDLPEAVRTRLDAYARQTAPLVDYYRDQGLLASISAEGLPSDVLNRTIEVLNQRRVAQTSRSASVGPVCSGSPAC
jgi:adenylate kinase